MDNSVQLGEPASKSELKFKTMLGYLLYVLPSIVPIYEMGITERTSQPYLKNYMKF
jgi:hypothetical protein